MINLATLKSAFERKHPGWELTANPHFMVNQITLTVSNSTEVSYIEAQNFEIAYGKLESLFPRRKGPTATKTLNIRQPWFTSSRSRRK